MAGGSGGNPENHPHRRRLCCCRVPSETCPSQQPLPWNLGEEGPGGGGADCACLTGAERSQAAEAGSGGGGATQTSPPNRARTRALGSLQPAALLASRCCGPHKPAPCAPNSLSGRTTGAGLWHPPAPRRTDGQTGSVSCIPECPQPGCSDRAGHPPTSPRCSLSFAEGEPVPRRDITGETTCAHRKTQRRLLGALDGVNVSLVKEFLPLVLTSSEVGA